MIDFTRAFGSAWERMEIILFRPVDVAKWFVIGFSAFLAGMIAGGNGVNSSFNPNGLGSSSDNGTSGSSAGAGHVDLQKFNAQVSHFFSGPTAWVFIGIFIAVFLIIVALTLLLFWLGARGQFMFLDNIVRNRGAIAGPWRYYARQANSFFLFYLLLEVVVFLLLIPIIVVAIVLCVPLFQQQRWPAGAEVGELVALGVLYLIIAVAAAVVLFLYREFGVPIMFRQGINARAAFFAAMRLIGAHSASVFVFVLLRMALFIGLAVICVLICCVTCCIGTLPYIGTVLLLPALVYLRCFTLDCLAQFGPEYDVWTVDVAPAFPGQGFPSNLPPPRG